MQSGGNISPANSQQTQLNQQSPSQQPAQPPQQMHKRQQITQQQPPYYYQQFAPSGEFQGGLFVPYQHPVPVQTPADTQGYPGAPNGSHFVAQQYGRSPILVDPSIPMPYSATGDTAFPTQVPPGFFNPLFPYFQLGFPYANPAAPGVSQPVPQAVGISPAQSSHSPQQVLHHMQSAPIVPVPMPLPVPIMQVAQRNAPVKDNEETPQPQPVQTDEEGTPAMDQVDELKEEPRVTKQSYHLNNINILIF